VADAVGNSRWSTAHIDDTITRVHTAGWKRILNANNSYRAASRSAVLSSTGTYPLSSLSSGAADSLERFYRVLGVRVGNYIYEEAPARDWLLAIGTGDTPKHRYYFANQSIYLPDAPDLTATIWVSHTPTPFGSISADNVAVTWPADYEDCLIYDAAAELLAMGAMEMGPHDDLKRMADAWWTDMLADIGRLSINPLQFQYSDSAHEWGG
jgi:hypothetical protein